MFPKSLKNMLLLAVAALVISTGIAVSQLVAHRYSSSLLAAAAARAEITAQKLSLEAADKILINDLVALHKMLEDQITSDPSVAYAFIVRNGILLTHTFADGVPVNLLQANTADGAANGRLEKIIAQDGQRFIDVAYPIFEGKAGTLRLGLSEAPYRSQVRRLWLQMSAITLGILALSLLVSQWVISRLTQPLRHLTEYAEQINEGTLDTQIAVRGRQEVTRLATAFNSMLARLQDYTIRLKESNRQLETKNHELDRTHKQLKTSFAISQQIAALPRLDQICQVLIDSLREVVQCRDLNLLVFNDAARTITLASAHQTRHLDQALYDPIHDELCRYKELSIIRHPATERLRLADWLGDAAQIALFPVRHHDLPVGAMVVACSGACTCIRHELDIVAMILHQAAGAIYRANMHEAELHELRRRVDAEAGYRGIVGRDPRMQVVFSLIDDVAPTDATVLIQGESGTGKELVARAIHERSARARKPFMVINCAAYPSTLLESELFGHEKGAFTGALRRKIGRFEQADGGTVFLDEIGEIEPAAQIKLLRVLQQQTIDRLGGDQSVRVNVRILAATNKNLSEEVRQGRFREDLFYRLNVIPIQLPPLRERPKDIHLLVQHFLERFAREQGKQISGFRSEAMRKLIDAPWPGNVRELENTIEHAVVLAKGNQIELKDLPTALVEMKTRPAEITPGLSIVESEEKLIREALSSSDWNKAEAARKLGISRSTLYEKIKKIRNLN